MYERRYPAGYIPLTMHELGITPRDSGMSNNEYRGNDEDNNRHGQRESQKRFSRSRREGSQRRNSNPRHVSRRRDNHQDNSNRGGLRFARNDRSVSDNDDF